MLSSWLRPSLYRADCGFVWDFKSDLELFSFSTFSSSLDLLSQQHCSRNFKLSIYRWCVRMVMRIWWRRWVEVFGLINFIRVFLVNCEISAIKMKIIKK